MLTLNNADYRVSVQKIILLGLAATLPSVVSATSFYFDQLTEKKILYLILIYFSKQSLIVLPCSEELHTSYRYEMSRRLK